MAEGKCSVTLLLNLHLLVGLCLWSFPQILPQLYSFPSPLNETRRLEGARVGAMAFAPPEIKLRSVFSSGVYYINMENALCISHNYYSSHLARARRGSFLYSHLENLEIEPVNMLGIPYECSPQEILTLKLVHIQSPAICQNYHLHFSSTLCSSNFCYR